MDFGNLDIKVNMDGLKVIDGKLRCVICGKPAVKPRKNYGWNDKKGKWILFMEGLKLIRDCNRDYVCWYEEVVCSSKKPKPTHDYLMKMSGLKDEFLKSGKEIPNKFLSNLYEELGSALETGINLMIHGKPGVGKTRAASLIVKKCVDYGYTAAITTGLILSKCEYISDIDKVKRAEREKWFEYIKKCDLLVIDEMAATDYEGKTRVVVSVFDERYGAGLSTIGITNMGLKKVNEVYEWGEGLWVSRMKRFDPIEYIDKDRRGKK
jgi:hypothetical protein